MRASSVISHTGWWFTNVGASAVADVRHHHEDADGHQQQGEASPVETRGLYGLVGGRHDRPERTGGEPGGGRRS